MKGKLSVEIHDKNPLGKYCVYGKSDVMRTNELSDVIMFIMEKVRIISNEPNASRA